ncbi:MAG: hypothetical protein QXT86_09910 [Archaeoglobaceae archaeon]
MAKITILTTWKKDNVKLVYVVKSDGTEYRPVKSECHVDALFNEITCVNIYETFQTLYILEYIYTPGAYTDDIRVSYYFPGSEIKSISYTDLPEAVKNAFREFITKARRKLNLNITYIPI